LVHQTIGLAEVKWCLTIPAIWTQKEKATMKAVVFCARIKETEDLDESEFH